MRRLLLAGWLLLGQGCQPDAVCRGGLSEGTCRTGGREPEGDWRGRARAVQLIYGTPDPDRLPAFVFYSRGDCWGGRYLSYRDLCAYGAYTSGADVVDLTDASLRLPFDETLEESIAHELLHRMLALTTGTVGSGDHSEPEWTALLPLGRKVMTDGRPW